MTRSLALVSLLVLATLRPAMTAHAADEPVSIAVDSAEEEQGLPISLEASEAIEIEQLQPPLSEQQVETHRAVSASAGYRFISTEGYGGRADRYTELRSSPTFSFLDSVLGRDHKLILDGAYQTEHDFNANLTYDYRGAYRVRLATDSLYHNLDRLTLSPAFAFVGSNYLPDQRDAGATYGIQVEQDLASLRARVGTYPIHLNMQYWRLSKQGNSQLRYADQAFFPAAADNTLYAASRHINRETHEGRLGFDAHLGHVDIIYDFTVRQFNNKTGTPADTAYVDRPAAANFYQRTPGGYYEHNEIPDSRYIAHSIKLHTEQTGGIVAAGGYTIAQRENRSSLSQVSGPAGLTDTLQTLAGDIVYTHSKELSMALRFRHQEINRDETPVTALNFLTPAGGNVITPHQGMDTTRDQITGIVSYRPATFLTVKGEYKGDFLHRDNVASWDPYMRSSGSAIPEQTDRHKMAITLLGKPLKGLKVTGKYSYTTMNSPDYAASYDNRHDGQILAVYTQKNTFGASANYQISHETNDSSGIRRLNYLPPTPNYDSVPVHRQRTAVSATASLWRTLLDGRLSLTGTAGLLRSNADQQVLFTSISDKLSATASNYTSQALLYGLTAQYRPVEKLETSLALQQIRSYAEFEPSYFSFNDLYTGVNDTALIKELSWIKTVENSATLRAAYQLYGNVGCSVEYRYRKYSDAYNAEFNGSVQSVMAGLTAKW